MLLLARPSTATVRMAGHHGLGLLATPRGLLRDCDRGLPWAADNDAFVSFDGRRFSRMLDWATTWPLSPLWVACPDMVGDARGTLDLWRTWQPEVKARGFRAALVAQDGMKIELVPWDEADAIFLGGTGEWKFSTEARQIVALARSRGKWVHAGRVQTRRKIRQAAWMGVDSIDGTCTAKLPDFWVPKILDWIADSERMVLEPELFEGWI